MPSLLDFLFPPLCVGCHRIGTRLCRRCQIHLTWLDAEWDVLALLHLPTELNHVWSAVEYRDLATTIVKEVKYYHHYDYTTLMAQIMKQAWGESFRPRILRRWYRCRLRASASAGAATTKPPNSRRL